MTNTISLEAIRSLLLTFPGVTNVILHRDVDAGVVFIWFRCANLDSLKEVARNALWSNVTVTLGDCHDRLCGESEDSLDLPGILRISDSVVEVPTQTEIFGIYLARTLRDSRLISDNECQRLHRQWNAIMPHHK